MAETNVAVRLDDTEVSQEAKFPSEVTTATNAPEINIGGVDSVTGNQPQAETPSAEPKAEVPSGESPAPDMADKATAPMPSIGEVVVPSNVIEGVFGEKQASAKEAKKQDMEQEKAKPDKAEKEASTNKRASRAPKVEISGIRQSEKSEKPTRGGRPPQPPGKEAPPSPSATAPENVSPTASASVAPVATMPEPPRDATRPGEKETIVYIPHAELFPFKDHPFQVRNDEAMKSLVASVKERGVDQPAIVRPREGGGYEIVAGHRRRMASELAGYENTPCVIRNMTDDEAVLAMAETNFSQRAEILPSERAKALKMQLEAIKHQGTKAVGVTKDDVGKRSNDIVAERNKMAVKQVQRYIALNNLVPDLMKFVDDKKIPFTPAVEMSYIRQKNQRYIAVAIEAQQAAPTQAQAQRMRELDQKGILNGDVIDGIMLEEKKEETRVILNSEELGKYFGVEKTPREMKDQILKLLDEWKDRQPPELVKPEKKQEQEL